MLIIVSYDIKDNKRRNKLHKTLKGYGMPVQYSVFECNLNQNQFNSLHNDSQEFVKNGDSILYYSLCDRCQTKISAIYKSPPISGLTIIV